MDAAIADRDGHRLTITIAEYLALPPAQRPPQLVCAGTAAGQLCQGAVFPKALRDGQIVAHFASRHHIDQCDHAARRPTGPLSTARTGSGVLRLTATPGTGKAQTWPMHSPVAYRSADQQSASLRTALTVLRGCGLEAELVVQWQHQRPMLAYEFFIHLDCALLERGEPRGHWGRIETVHHHPPTGSTHLVPHAGTRVVIDAATSTTLGLDNPAQSLSLAGSDVLAVAPLRRARSGRLYVLVTDPRTFAWL